MNKIEKDYDEKYGDLSYDSDELLAWFSKEHRLNMNAIRAMEEEIAKIEWRKIQFIIPVIPKASPRPKYSKITQSFYVKGAAATKKMIQRYIDATGIICTRVKFHLVVYLQMPSAMTINEMYLAEKGVILPIQTPDFDNVAKTYSDALQDVLIINDNIINPGVIEKYYSFKPRVEITIEYQTDFDCEFNRKKVERSITYNTMAKEDIRDAR